MILFIIRMAFDTKKFPLALALTMGILYVLCAIVVWVAPDFALQLLGWVAHLVNVDKFAGDVAMTFGGVIIGLIEIFIYAYIAGWLFAWVYGRVSKAA